MSERDDERAGRPPSPAAGGPAWPDQGQQPDLPAYGSAGYEQGQQHGQSGYAPGQQYGQPGYGPQYGYPPPRGTNGLAIASLVLGILWLYWIGSVLALVFGYTARKQIRERGESGAGMATAGIVLGWIGVGFFVFFIVVGVVASMGAAT